MSGILLAKAIHLVGVLCWIAGMFFCARILAFLSNRPAGLAGDKDLTVLLKRTAMVADIGFTIALLAGLHSAFAYGYIKQPWLAGKLLLVVVTMFLHVFLRREVRRAHDGRVPAAFPMLPVLALLVVAIVVLAVLRPFSS